MQNSQVKSIVLKKYVTLMSMHLHQGSGVRCALAWLSVGLMPTASGARSCAYLLAVCIQRDRPAHELWIHIVLPQWRYSTRRRRVDHRTSPGVCTANTINDAQQRNKQNDHGHMWGVCWVRLTSG